MTRRGGRSFVQDVSERVLVCDGAVGTMLYARGVFLNRCFDELNLTQPDLVAEVHQSYVRAGADVLETNTFGANRIKLASFGLSERVRAINVQGAQIARHAAREEAWVAGSIGPLGIRIEPWGRTSVDEAEAYFREQAAALREGGVDLFVLETFRDLNEIGAAIRAVRSVCALPIVAQMTTEEDGNSLDGTPPETFAPELVRFGADVIGVNCSVGPAAMLETIERIARLGIGPLSAQPNAGRPREVEGRNIYLSSPEYMASYARRFILNGVKLVGGCCGTTPEHIRLIRQAVRAAASAPLTKRGPSETPAPPSEPAPPPASRSEKTRMANALSRGQFVVAVEVEAPRGYRYEEVVDQARQLRIRGADVITVPDAGSRGARMSALAVCVLLQQQVGIETILVYPCRHRTLLRMQSDLLGAHAIGLRNLVLVTGEPEQVGDYADATVVSDVDSIGLTNAVARLNQGFDVGGEPIGRPTAFHVGVSLNTSALNLDEEIRRFAYKVEAGAEFAITEPIFDARLFERVVKRLGDRRIPIIARLVPLESLQHAEYLANEEPGVTIPEPMMQRLRLADTPAAAAAEGIAFARETLTAIRELVQGVQLSTAGTPGSHAVDALEGCLCA